MSLSKGTRLGVYEVVALIGKGVVTIEEVRRAPPPTHLILVQNFGAELERLVPTKE